MSAPAPAPHLRATNALRVTTRLLDDPGQLIPLLDPHHPLLWMRRREGMAGIGEALRLEFAGPTRIRDAAAAWQQVVASAEVDDGVGLPGTGLTAFGAFTFSPSSSISSVLIVPEVIVGRHEGRAWITRVSRLDDDTLQPADAAAAPHAVADRAAAAHPLNPHAAPHAVAFGDEYRLSLLPGSMPPAAYREAVRDAVTRIRRGDLEKVVLARDLEGRLPLESDLRRALMELALGYPECWTYAVDGLIGSSPETLVRVRQGEVSARVLAGTISRGPDAAADHERAITLAANPKDQDEHAFAVQSVLEALAPHSPNLVTSELPFTLKLPNLWHLATDIAGTLGDGSTALDLVAALHPTAAVAGTPTADAMALIDELEPFDRGRYAGPVGWVGADGDGEWAIALRGAQVSDTGAITAYAGCGIVAESDPERELAESTMKLRPITEALG
ncbi:chorismate-binding protein [Microbacterium sp. STN6]|uniref:isochorismate synthase n=1 Tax=Microbacterium sp. STN6 TaxID=2995588 RepID=UPI002260D387|nr:chorismate-binding protein [Microbacterium sp. STN6]MCX7520691.1 chorismate-binding protein [Microbacterium sp. STN6]